MWVLVRGEFDELIRVAPEFAGDFLDTPTRLVSDVIGQVARLHTPTQFVAALKVAYLFRARGRPGTRTDGVENTATEHRNMERTGTILRGREFEPVEGRIVIDEAGRIEAIEEAAVESDDIICPAFVNAHTHIGDSIAKEAGRGLSLEELVAPPDGLKHRLLRSADREDLVREMRRSLRFMQESGTAACLDFREAT